MWLVQKRYFYYDTTYLYKGMNCFFLAVFFISMLFPVLFPFFSSLRNFSIIGAGPFVFLKSRSFSKRPMIDFNRAIFKSVFLINICNSSFSPFVGPFFLFQAACLLSQFWACLSALSIPFLYCQRKMWLLHVFLLG